MESEVNDCVCYRKEDTVRLENNICKLGKEMEYEIPTLQMQYDAADKETNTKDQC